MRVVVAEDIMLTREGIIRLLRDAGIDVVAHAGDAEALLREVRAEQPDVAVVDIRMPPTHTDEGLVAARAIRADHPEIGVLLLSQYVEPSYAMRLIQDHPERVGYLLKERVFDIATVVDALRRIVDGETVIDPTIVARLLGRRRRADPLEGLTGREREVLGLVAQWKGKYRAPLVGMPVPPPPHHRFCPSYRRCHGWRCGLGKPGAGAAAGARGASSTPGTGVNEWQDRQ